MISDERYALLDIGHVKKSEEFVSVLSLTNPFMPDGAIKVDPDHVHVVWSASKLFGVSGLRIVSLALDSSSTVLIRTGLLCLAAQPQAYSNNSFSHGHSY